MNQKSEMDQRKKKFRDKKLHNGGDKELVVEKAGKSIGIEKGKKRKKSSRNRLQTPNDKADLLNLRAKEDLVAQNADSDQFDLKGEDADKPRKAGKPKRGKKNIKNGESLENCKDLVVNGEKTVQLEAYQPSVDSGEFLKGEKRKAKKSSKKKRKVHISPDIKRTTEPIDDVDENGVYQISSGDEDASKGMKKWITEYHESRPGLKVLQHRIDDFITAHEEKLEQERKEKEAQAADGGWTVVVHHRGRKKTVDAETGVTVGSVAQTAVEDKMSKKKRKEVGPDFYRFQRREAQRNEVLMLQSKFEEDKKRIQQYRAARKFRPY